MNDKYIGISDDRLHHILGVARKCYKIAKEEGFDEDFCRKMFMIGWNHDVGYEFSKIQTEHPKISSVLLHQMMYFKTINDISVPLKTNYAIYYHGKIPDESIMFNDEWRILNIADMTIDSKGNEVSVDKRLEEIKERYKEDSKQYTDAINICKELKLI